MIIDGSYGEGGGQILRTSIALAAILGEDVEIRNIRAKRRNPGLRPQHLWDIKLVGMMSNANISGLKVGSSTVHFSPQKIRGGEYRIDVGTAGSITLILQSSILPALFADSKVTLKITGGTDVAWSPPIDYYRFVLLPILRKMNADIKIDVFNRGYYPEGGGSVKVEIEPGDLEGVRILQRGPLVRSSAYLNLRRLPNHILKRMKNKLAHFEIFEDVMDHGKSAGCGVVLVKEFKNTIIGSDSLCKKGMPSEKVVERAIVTLKNELDSKATVDQNMGDHLIPFGFIARGSTEYHVSKITEHIKTNAWVVERFGGKVNIHQNKVEIN